MKKFKKILKRILVCIAAMIAAIAVVLLGINLYVRQMEKKRIISPDEAKEIPDVDCIVVLGASVHGDTPSHMLKDRLDMAIELYKAGCAEKIIMSGDHGGYYYDEVTTMKNYAIQAGVPSEDIFKDHSGFSTYDTVYRAKEIFGAKKVIFVSQEYHLPRCLYIAQALDLDAYGVSSAYVKYKGQAKRDIREALAIVKDFCMAIVKPEASDMGDTISLKQNGDITNEREDITY